MSDDELKRNWRVALQRVAEGSECECECDDEECCEEVEEIEFYVGEVLGVAQTSGVKVPNAE